ncbi:hypothetical protein [Nocardiopsis sp. NRRL B-16309]|uniref:hypothetical protein n=1 Tax=Nocardiopsis sp. NRRL B-16309 TaxID=1519494 RepID=UPI0006B0535A|nr:hypothetical protein [Nocardiopsis sp. NRRL B-16309]KOX11672.1 hypothetical protein ADL05_23210 [Nocardiopsis sp. NRRL B-16309]
MIRTDSYTDQIDTRRDLLAAFSAYDHSTTKALDGDQVDGLLLRLLLRLGALCSLHGPDVPRRLVQTVEQTPDPELFGVVNAFLECGQPVQEGEQVRELQQELLHFSRIVDLGEAGFAAPAQDGIKRLRRSHRIPDSLKVLSELLIVVRARMAQRGAPVALPTTRRPGLARTEVADALIAHPAEHADHVLTVRSAKARPRKQALYYFTQLLAYLTPVEAATALCAYLAETPKLASGLELALLYAAPSGQVETLHWRADTVGAGTVFDRALALLPDRSTVAAAGAWTIGAHTDGADAAAITVDGALARTVALAPAGHDGVDLDTLTEQAAAVISAYRGPQIRSIECGHIHLNRDLDPDQVAGARIGAAARAHLAGVQDRPPLMTPMVDDDHVLVKLRPRDYTAFLTEHLDGAPFSLIVESSPIVRAIACALYQRLATSARSAALVRRGDNLFVELPDGVCELFEDLPGAAVTGCVMFEVALLVYRTDPGAFDEYFDHRFPREGHIHADACAVLDSDAPHDDKVERLARLYAPFAPVTDPRTPDEDFTAFLQAFLASLAAPAGHLNVLEDYYEVQQDKVRALLRFLDIPIALSTLHFNTHTGRTHLALMERESER